MENDNPLESMTKTKIEMKKINPYKIFFAAVLAAVISSCQKAEPLLYEQDANIHFALTGNDRDSIMYTFAYDITRSSDTILIPVQIAGHRSDAVRQFAAYVEQDSSTAVADLHYKALEPTYPLPADSGTAFLPLIIYNVAELEEKSVSLIIKLEATDDLGINDPRLIRAKLVFSARLEQPQWWSMWLGGYSRTKHQLFLITTEQTSMTMDGLDAPRNLYYVNLLTMMLNNPFAWVENNPEKGYVLTARDPSEDEFDFYHVDNPARKMLLRKNQASGRYFFIDENGVEVN